MNFFNNHFKSIIGSIKVKLFFILLIFSHVMLYSQDEASYALKPKTFSTNPDLLGVLSNSVNLFTGQVNFPLNLISLKSGNALNMSFSILYSSNIDKTVDTRNLDAPTSILGVGWTLDIPQIVSDNKGTASREDDDFYLIEGGINNKLICTNINQNIRAFESKKYNNWLINYDINSEKWTITKEDGTKYIFGDDNSGRMTVQYVVAWGNWIGNAAESGGQQRAFIWNLSQVIDISGNYIQYTYENINEALLNNTAKQTVASYLKKVTDSYNREIELYYSDKTSAEYQDPHTEVNEPDAYQERYEKEKLDSLYVKNSDDVKLLSIHFTSEVVTHNGIRKRFLTSIIEKNLDEESQVPLLFNYITTSNNYGALQDITIPTGGKVTYYYDSQQIEHSELNGIADAPSGYGEPRVFIHNNYVVITWRDINHSEDFRNAVVQAYEWDGKWIKVIDQSIGTVKLINLHQDFSVTLQDDFFALMTATRESATARPLRLYAFSKDHTKKGVWNDTTLFTSDYNIIGQLTSGKNFIGIKYSQLDVANIHDYVKIFGKIRDSWQVDKEIDIGIVGSIPLGPLFDYRTAISAGENFLLVFNGLASPDRTNLYYYAGDNILKTAPQANLGIQTSGDPSYLYSNNFSCLLFGAGTSEYIYDWDENYNNFTQRSTIGPYPDYSITYPTGSGYGVMKGDFWRSFFARRKGVNWLQSAEGLHRQLGVAFGDDYFVYVQQGNYNITLRRFNANTASFQDQNFNSSSYHSLKAGKDIFTANELIYNRQTNGPWTLNGATLYIPSGGIYNTTIRHGLNFIAYNSSTGTTINTYFIPVKNGNPLTQTQLSGQKVWQYGDNAYAPIDKSELVGTNIIVTYSASLPYNQFRDDTSLNLYKVMDDQVTGKVAKYFVKGFKVNDGTNDFYTAVHYYSSNALIDPSGSITQYNKVRVIPGGSVTNYDPNVHPYGYTDNYFFNGLAKNELALAFPDNDSGVTNADDYYKLLTGNIYESRVYDANNNLKSSVKNYWYVYSKNINNDIGYYYRINKKERMGDGVTTTASYSYNSSNGQISQVVSGPILDSNLVTTTTYAFENNSAMQTANLLMQPYETRVAAASISQTSLTVSVSGMDSYDSKSFTPVITQTISIDFSYYNGSVMIGTTPGGNEIFSASGSGNGYGSDNRTVNAGIIYYVTALTEGSEFALLAPTNEANITVHFYPGRTISLQRTEYDASNSYLPYKTSIYDGTSWVVTNTVTNRNSYGIPEESYDVNGSYSTIKYGYNDMLPIANIKNAKNSETVFGNFEDGTAGEWDTWTSGSSSTTAHTGEYGWYLVGSQYRHIAKSLQASDINTSGKYKVSGWVKSSSIFHPKLQWYVKYNNGASEAYLTPVNAVSTGDWEYIQSTIDLSSYSNITFIEAFALNGDQMYYDNCWWDDLLIAPVNAIVTTQTYDSVTLQVTSKSDINGVPVFYQYDSFGRLTQTTNADSAVLSQTIYYLSREHNGGSFNSADPNYIQTKTYPDGASSTPLMVTTFTDGLGRTLQTHKRSNYNDIVSAVEYDDAGRQYRAYKPFSTSTLSYTTSYTSQPYSEIIYYSDPLSRIQYTKPAGSTSSNEWTETKYGSATINDQSDPYNGQLLNYTETYHRVGSNVGRTVVRAYTDKLGRTVRQESFIEGSQNKIVSITKYNMAGSTVSETDPNGYVSTGSFSTYLNRLIESNNVDNGTTKYFYNQAGQIRFMKDAAGEAASPDKTLYWKYDDLGRVIEKGYINTDWNSVITHVEEQSYPSTPSTWRKKYFYDDFSITPYAWGKLCKVQTNNDDDSAVEVEETFKYDKFGNTIAASSNVTDFSADIYNALYSYDNLGRVTQIDYPLYKTVSSVHDLNVGSSSEYDASSPTTMTVGPSVTIQNGGTANLAARDGITLSSGFSALSGSVFKASTNTYLVVKYTYNQLGEVIGVGNKTNNHYFANYYYNADGTLNQEKLNNFGTTTNYQYNNSRGFLTSISNSNFTENLAYSNTNTYYNGSIASASFTYGTGGPSSYSYTYQYDENNRMTSAVNSANSAYSFTSIQYDDNGNIDSRMEGSNSVSFTYSGSNVPTEYTKNSSNYGLSHDENGNLTSISPYLTVSYDPFTMLTKGMSEHDIINTSYEYDGRKERILKYVNNGGNEETTLYLRGTDDYPLTQKSSNENQFYIYGPTGLIALIDDDATYYVLKDHLGSTRVVLNSSNTAVSWYDYVPYGNVWRSTVNKDADYKFTGQELDTELGLYNFRARMYDPDLGIFYASDPANQDFSPYMYVGGNPVIRVDKNGRWFWEIFQIVSTAYSIFQGFVKDGEVGALKNAVIAGVGGSLGQIGGGTFWENLGYGVAEGVITGGLSDALWGGNGSGIWKGAIIGGGFATITSGIEAYRNFNDYGQFKTDSDLLTDLMSIGNNEEAAIYFAQKRYGFDDVNVSYDSKLSDYGITSPDGTIKLGYPALRSADDLKISLAHEWSHSKFDRLLDAKGNFVGWKSSASFETGPVNPTNGLKPASIYDAPSGYPAEVTLSGKLHISLSYMTRIDLATNGMLYYNVLSWHSMGIEKWWYWLPKR